MTISTEQFLSVNTGISANDGTGDSLREAFIKVNENFNNITEIGFDAGNIYCQGSIETAGLTITGNATLEGITVVSGNITISNVYVPTANSDPGNPGQITWDEDYVYICIATDTWKRANISTW